MRVHCSVWKIVFNVVICLDVQVLVFVSCLEYLHNPAATSVKQCHSREEFVQNDVRVTISVYSVDSCDVQSEFEIPTGLLFCTVFCMT